MVNTFNLTCFVHVGYLQEVQIDIVGPAFACFVDDLDCCIGLSSRIERDRIDVNVPGIRVFLPDCGSFR